MPERSNGIDLARVRADTPGCTEVLHFNNAGASLMPKPVLDATTAYLEREGQIGGYETAREADGALERTYDAAASLINCARDEIAIVENATRGWDMAFYAFGFGEGDRILTAEAEYGSNFIAYLQIARRTGVEIVPVPSDETGQLSVTALENLIDQRVKLISVTHVPTNGGLVNPAAEIGKIARAANVPYILDACQSVGQMPIDVEAIGCDVLTTTSRKYLRGPRGVGFLYVRRGWIERLEPPLLDQHAAHLTGPDSYEIRNDARRFENWEANFAGKAGMGVAIDYALNLGLPAIWQRVQALSERLRSDLSAIPGVTLRDLGTKQCGIVSFTVDGQEPMNIRDNLATQRINVTASRRSSTYLDMTKRGLEHVVRASVHYYNSEQEIDRFCAAIEELSGS